MAGCLCRVGGGSSSTELIDTAVSSWSGAASMGTPRYPASSALFSNGKVLVTGGWNDGTFNANAEVFDQAGNSWSAAGNLSVGRYIASSTLLPNGKVLVVGGTTTDGSYPATAEIYPMIRPATAGARPAVSAPDVPGTR